MLNHININDERVIPKISIILPVYNVEEQYLIHCLDSLKNQSLKDIEIILIDDGSTNNCGLVCDNYSIEDTRIKVIHQKNQGVSIARNRGIEESSANWIIFVDPDDWVEPTMCEEVYNNVNKDVVDILLFTFYSNSKTKEIPHYFGNTEKFRFLPEDHDLLQLSIMESFKGYSPLVIGSIWAKVFNRQFLNVNNIRYSEHLPKSQDLVFCLHAIEHAKSISYLNKAFYHYRENDASVCHKYNSKIFSYIENLNREVKLFLKKYNKSDAFQKAYYNMVISFFKGNMILDFFHKDNSLDLLHKRKLFLNTINSEPYKTAFQRINYKAFSRKDRLKLTLIKLRCFFILHKLYSMKNKS